MDKSHRLPIDLSEQEYEAIGALTAHYSQLEFQVGMPIWQLLKLEAYDGMLIVGPLSLAQRLNLLVSLLQNRHADDGSIAQLKAIGVELAKDNGITARRNRYIHALWSAKNGDETITTMNFAKQGHLKTATHSDVEEIEAVTRDIATQAKLLVTALGKLGLSPRGANLNFQAPPKPSPGKPS